jgi:hypothetical protein
LSRACDKTGLDAARLETVVENLELQLQQRTAKEVASSEIGELVLKGAQANQRSRLHPFRIGVQTIPRNRRFCVHPGNDEHRAGTSRSCPLKTRIKAGSSVESHILRTTSAGVGRESFVLPT